MQLDALYRLVFGFRSQFGLWEPLENRQRQLPATSCQMGPDRGLNTRFLAGFPLASDLHRANGRPPAPPVNFLRVGLATLEPGAVPPGGVWGQKSKVLQL